MCSFYFLILHHYMDMTGNLRATHSVYCTLARILGNIVGQGTF